MFIGEIRVAKACLTNVRVARSDYLDAKEGKSNHASFSDLRIVLLEEPGSRFYRFAPWPLTDLTDTRKAFDAEFAKDAERAPEAVFMRSIQATGVSAIGKFAYTGWQNGKSRIIEAFRNDILLTGTAPLREHFRHL